MQGTVQRQQVIKISLEETNSELEWVEYNKIIQYQRRIGIKRIMI